MEHGSESQERLLPLDLQPDYGTQAFPSYGTKVTIPQAFISQSSVRGLIHGPFPFICNVCLERFHGFHGCLRTTDGDVVWRSLCPSCSNLLEYRTVGTLPHDASFSTPHYTAQTAIDSTAHLVPESATYRLQGGAVYLPSSKPGVSPQYVSEEIPQEFVPDMPEDIVPDLSQDMHQAVFQTSLEDPQQHVPKNASQQSTQHTPVETFGEAFETMNTYPPALHDPRSSEDGDNRSEHTGINGAPAEDLGQGFPDPTQGAVVRRAQVSSHGSMPELQGATSDHSSQPGIPHQPVNTLHHLREHQQAYMLGTVLPLAYSPELATGGMLRAEPTHPLTTSGSRPVIYRCKSCDQEFNRHCDLKMHIKKHTKPYRCTIPCCDGAYSSARDRTRHELSHNGTPRFRCDFPECGHKTARMDSLRRHMSTAHTSKVESAED